MSEPLLECDSVCVDYGPVAAVRGVSIRASAGAITAIVGANGAGKSSLLRAISGVSPVSRGHIRFDGAELVGMPPHLIARRGVAHVPEGRRVIAPLSVEDNLLLGSTVAKASRSERAELLAEVYETFSPLKPLRRRLSGALSGGEQQMLAFGRALMARPRCLLLDEPSMGLAPIMITAIFNLLSDPPPSVAQMAILLSEQSAALAFRVADYAYVLSNGTVEVEGTPDTLANQRVVIDAYLGSSDAKEK